VTRILPILWDTLGVAGLLSVAATVAAAALILLGVSRPRRFRAWFAATLAAAAALGLAAVASWQVRTIEVDRSAEVQAAEQAGARAAQEKLRSRAAAIRFAEDTTTDQADVAGVTVAEEEGAYERAVAEELAKQAAYRRGGPKTRSGRKPVEAGPEPAPGEESAEAPAAAVRRLPEAQLVIADRYDRVNRAFAWSLFALAAGLCGCEYVRRFNTTTDTVWPLPLAGTVIDGLTAKEHAARLPADRLPEFLELAVRKGETFIAFASGDPLPAAAALDRFSLGPLGWRIPKRPVSAAALVADPGLLETVFETAWFGRGCFVVTGAGAGTVLERMVEMLELRRRTRAAAGRTLDLVWALAENPPPAADRLGRLAPRLNVRWILASPAAAADH
jgi:hypothetical protein